MRGYDEFDIDHVLKDAGGVRLSLFAPMERVPTGAEKNAILFKNLVRQAREKLARAGMDQTSAQPIEQRLLEILEDEPFWQHQSRGLAVFASPEKCLAYRLPIEVPEHVYVGDRYQLLPLLPLIVGDERVVVIALSQEKIRWFETGRYSTDELMLPAGVPKSLAEVTGSDVEEQHLQLHSTGAGDATYHGHGGGKDDVEAELERFCREVGAALASTLRERGSPGIVLAGDPKLVTMFDRAAKLPGTVHGTVHGNFDDADAGEIHRRVAPILGDRDAGIRDKAIERFRTAEAKELTTVQPDAIASAAQAGRVAELLVHDVTESSKQHPDAPQPATLNDEFSNTLAIDTLRHGGLVRSIPQSLMPDSRYVAAVLRY
jgi:hypothetical protein